MTLEWPFDEVGVTYVVGSVSSMKELFPNRKVKTKFIKELKGMGDVPVKRRVKFVPDAYVSDEFLYVVDSEGLQLVVQLEEDQPIDISKFDA